LALLKFGNPVILDAQIQAPASPEEWLLQPWPIVWGYAFLCGLLLLGFSVWRWRTEVPRWLLVLPLVWLGWQGLSALQTVDLRLTLTTLKHFAAGVAAYYLGLFAFSRVSRLNLFWIAFHGGLLAVLLVGLRQHFGGLEETQRYFFGLPDWKSYPPEFIEKVSSQRVYSTLVYPNALAGAVILLLPISLFHLWASGSSWPFAIRLAAVGTMAVLGLGCLYWSGSKAGWLLALAQCVGLLCESRFNRQLKIIFVLGLFFVGMASFWIKYQTYFQRGATSVSARFDYWRIAAQTFLRQPLLGSGPGTFMVRYKQFKSPEAEMARLAHNDYLQQGSDSGLVGFLAYATWIFGGVWFLYRRSSRQLDTYMPGLVLGLGGISLHGMVEFGLYIPALSWPMFFLLGWGLGSATARKPQESDTFGPTAAKRRGMAESNRQS
jgi:O-antigen ligase